MPIKVVAKGPGPYCGFYGLKRRKPGEVFDFHGTKEELEKCRWMEEYVPGKKPEAPKIVESDVRKMHKAAAAGATGDKEVL